MRAVAARPGGRFGLGVLVALLLVLVLAPLITRYPPDAQDLARRLTGPGLAHPLGTDQLGRDLWSRLVFGTRVTLGVAGPAVAAALAVGMTLGLLAGYGSQAWDRALVTVMDVIQSFPAVVLALVLLALLGPSARDAAIVIAVAFIPGYARVSRALTLALKARPFVEAERALGAGTLRILVVHLVPNLLGPLLVLVAMDLPSAIAIQAGLDFLGVGVQPPAPSWGGVLADGFEYVRQSPWGIVWGSLTLVVVTLGFTLLGEALRDTLDPRVARITGARRPA
ncbi:MAG TPA: ABC transporter permease [Candidatus Dormibacteraeota bacterium]|nr:ABC transporter permease [Candidatus Dormibacteraeota bacterium]